MLLTLCLPRLPQAMIRGLAAGEILVLVLELGPDFGLAVTCKPFGLHPRVWGLG